MNRTEIEHKVDILKSTVEDICDAIYVRSDNYIRCNGLVEISNQILNIPRTLIPWTDLGYETEPEVIGICYNNAFDYVQKQGETPITTMRNYFANDTTLLFSPYVGDTTNVSDWYGCFNGCASLLQISDKYQFNNAQNFESICYQAKNLRWFPTITAPKLNNLYQAFRNCSALESVDVSNWNTTDVRNMGAVFMLDAKLKELKTNNWNTENVTTLQYFARESGIESIDVTNWNTNKCTNFQHVFYQCNKLRTVGDSSNLDFTNAEDISGMFYGCNQLSSLNVENWSFPKLTSLGQLFGYCSSLLDLKVDNWDVSNITNFDYMFTACSSMREYRLLNWNVSNGTSFNNLFSGNTSLRSLDLSTWKPNNPINVYYMFGELSNVTSYSIKDLGSNGIADARYCFYNNTRLPSLDLSNWDFSTCVTFDSVFRNCAALTEIIGVIDLSSTNNTDSNTNNMFSTCRQLRSVRIKNLNTSINFNASPLDYDSLSYMINNAQTVTNKTITLSATSFAWIDDTLRGIATSKGFTIAR